MIIYYSYIIYIFLIHFSAKGNHNKKTHVFLLWLGMFLIMSLRSSTVGNDIERYLDFYEGIRYVDPSNPSTEIGYLYLLKLFEWLNISQQGYLVLTSLIISSSFSWFIYKYSISTTATTLSFFLHITIGLFAMTMSGIRQSLAISIVLFGIHFAFKRKFLTYTFFILLAYTFHSSALIFYPAYFLFKLKLKSYKTIFYITIAILVVFLFNHHIFSYFGLSSFVTNIFPSGRYYELYIESGNLKGMNFLPVFFRISLLLMVAMYWRVQNVNLRSLSNFDTSFFYLGTISVFFSIISLNLSVIERLSYYFFAPFIILIPNTLVKYKNKNTSNYHIFVLILFIISILHFGISTPGGILKIDNYKFFWSRNSFQ